MTIKQYEILRNRLDGILGSETRPDLKVKRLQNLADDLLVGFSCRFALDMFDEIMHHIISIDVDINAMWDGLAR